MSDPPEGNSTEMKRSGALVEKFEFKKRQKGTNLGDI